MNDREPRTDTGITEYRRRIVAVVSSLVIYWVLWNVLASLVAEIGFLSRFSWQFVFLMAGAGVLAVIGAFGGVKISRFTLFLRLLITFLVGYITGGNPVVPALFTLALIQEAGFRQNLHWCSGIIFASIFISLVTVLPTRRVFGVSIEGMNTEEVVIFLILVLPAVVLALGFRAAIDRERRWRETVDRLDLAVSRLAEANLGYQSYAQDVRGSSITEERRRISREIHDSVGYSLTNIRVMLEASIIRLSSNQEETVRLIEQSMKEAELCLDQTRQAMRQLRGREISVATGTSAIQRLVNAFSDVTGISVAAEYGNVPSVWPLETEKAVYRLVQEGMTNAFRHGMATEITIYFWQDQDVLRLIIRDNGSGTGEVKEGIGIAGMRERMEALGGGVEVGARSGGFEVRAWVPIPMELEDNENTSG